MLLATVSVRWKGGSVYQAPTRAGACERAALLAGSLVALIVDELAAGLN